MLYKEFQKICKEYNQEFLSDFDYWLATIPASRQENISVSLISSIFQIPDIVAKTIVDFCKNEGILKEYYIVECPNEECRMPITVGFDEIADVLINPCYCHNCENNRQIALEDIYPVYKRIKEPDIIKAELDREIEKRLSKSHKLNFNKADSLGQRGCDFLELF